MKEYIPSEIEAKWQKVWAQSGLFKMNPKTPKPKYYCLMMFPYPSAALHVGHGRNYIIGDVVARYKIMKGYNVLAPMGWDAFGLPAENAAIKGAEHPRTSTLRNIATMKKQLYGWGVGYDWDREVASCLPEYYKWTQWIFVKMFEKGLAYKKFSLVNWCPSCQTVLANEQVIDGCCERCDSKVKEKDLEQWFFKITAYAERLLADLKKLDHWPERVKMMQENWIGKSAGTEIYFKLAGTEDQIACFTTRVDTIYGATYMVLAPEHPLVKKLVKGTEYEKKVEQFLEMVSGENKIERAAADKEKNGMYIGKDVVNPYNGKKIPLWIADYVLMEYGTGAVMAVPAHDQRDFMFAKKYGLPIQIVIQKNDEASTSSNHPLPSMGRERPADEMAAVMTEAYEGDGTVVNSMLFDGMQNRAAIDKMAEYGEKLGFAKKTVHYKLRDWLISRQRYWGAPIPVVYCEKCGAVAVPEKDLPVLLPETVEFRPTGESPLARCPEFMQTTCPTCGGAARRESDTMDTFVDSSWYFLRYLSPRDDNRPFDGTLVNKWLPVDQYIGGIEHAILHLMYARFITKVIKDLGAISFDEPFGRLFTQGMIIKDGAKMSKSKGNTVSPDPLIARYGADTVRLYTLFIGPPEKDAEWNDQAVEGSYRFLKRAWKIIEKYADEIKKTVIISRDVDDASFSLENKKARDLRRMSHEAISKVSADMEGDFHFNTAIASVMELMNFLYECETEVAGWDRDAKTVFYLALVRVVKLLAPFVPHFSEELWQLLGGKGSVFHAGWPSFSEKALGREELTIVVQVNGKVRSRLLVPSTVSEESIKEMAVQDDKVKECIKGKEVIKVVAVPKKLVNVVVK